MIYRLLLHAFFWSHWPRHPSHFYVFLAPPPISYVRISSVDTVLPSEPGDKLVIRCLSSSLGRSWDCPVTFTAQFQPPPTDGWQPYFLPRPPLARPRPSAPPSAPWAQTRKPPRSPCTRPALNSLSVRKLLAPSTSIRESLGALTEMQNEHHRHERSGWVKTLFLLRRLWEGGEKRISTGGKWEFRIRGRGSGVLPVVAQGSPRSPQSPAPGAWSVADCPPLRGRQVPATMGPPFSWPGLCLALVPHFQPYLLGPRFPQFIVLLRYICMVSTTWPNIQWLLDQ